MKFMLTGSDEAIISVYINGCIMNADDPCAIKTKKVSYESV